MRVKVSNQQPYGADDFELVSVSSALRGCWFSLTLRGQKVIYDACFCMFLYLLAETKMVHSRGLENCFIREMLLSLNEMFLIMDRSVLDIAE